jgi:hypothetical protein
MEMKAVMVLYHYSFHLHLDGTRTFSMRPLPNHMTHICRNNKLLSFGLVADALPQEILRIFKGVIDEDPMLGPAMRKTLVSSLNRRFRQGRQDRKYEEMKRLVKLAKDNMAPEFDKLAAALILIDGRENYRVINEPCDWAGPYPKRVQFVEKFKLPINDAMRKKYGTDIKAKAAMVARCTGPVEIRKRDREPNGTEATEAAATTSAAASTSNGSTGPGPTPKGKGRGKNSKSKK